MSDKTQYLITFMTDAGNFAYRAEWSNGRNTAELFEKVKAYHEQVMRDAEDGGFLLPETYPACVTYDQITIQTLDGVEVPKEVLD